MNVSRRMSAAALALCVTLVGGNAAIAGDPTEDPNAPAKALLAEIAAAKKDDVALKTALDKVAPLYKSTKDAAIRASFAGELGRALKADKMFESRKAALKALVEIEDPKVGWKEIGGVYPADDSEDPEKWDVEIVKAVGAIHPDGAIQKLLQTFQKAKIADLAGAAVTALGNYHSSQRRVAIRGEIVKISKLLVPSRSANKNPSAETTARWSTLEPLIAKALDALTGQTVGTVNGWFTKVDESKKNLKALFKD